MTEVGQTLSVEVTNFENHTAEISIDEGTGKVTVYRYKALPKSETVVVGFRHILEGFKRRLFVGLPKLPFAEML